MHLRLWIYTHYIITLLLFIFILLLFYNILILFCDYNNKNWLMLVELQWPLKKVPWQSESVFAIRKSGVRRLLNLIRYCCVNCSRVFQNFTVHSAESAYLIYMNMFHVKWHSIMMYCLYSSVCVTVGFWSRGKFYQQPTETHTLKFEKHPT